MLNGTELDFPRAATSPVVYDPNIVCTAFVLVGIYHRLITIGAAFQVSVWFVGV